VLRTVDALRCKGFWHWNVNNVSQWFGNFGRGPDRRPKGPVSNLKPVKRGLPHGVEHARESIRIRRLNMQVRGLQRVTQQLRDQVMRLQAELDAAEEREDAYLRVIDSNRETINALLAMIASGDADERMEGIPAEVAESVEGFKGVLAEWIKLSSVPEPSRRYSDDLLQIAFVLFKHSPAAYHFIRQIVPLPSRQTLFRHFRFDLIEQAILLTDPSQIEANLRARCEECGAFPDDVVVAVDATGASDTGEKGGAGYLWVVMVLSTDPSWGEFVAQIAGSAHGNHRHVVELEDAVCLACANLGMTVRFLATDGDHDVDERTREAFALWEELLVSPAERRGARAEGWAARNEIR
jgi:hypothetical protein